MTVTPGTGSAGGRQSRGELRSVTFVRFFLCFTEPGAITVPARPSHEDDAPWGRERANLRVDTDPLGRPALPGTSLAGALRELVRDVAGEETAKDLFGHLLPNDPTRPEVDSRASRIWVLGSRPAGVDPTQLRASTAISRERGAAEVDTLRFEELLPAGSRFEVFLRWDDAPRAEVERLAGWIAGWRPLIGHGVSRGRGQCVTEDVRYGVLDLRDPADLLRWLSLSGPELVGQVATEAGPDAVETAAPRPLARVRLEIIGPLRVGSGEPPALTGDEGPQITPMFRSGADYVLPGSGLKGLLRSRAEFILRSVGAEPEPCRDQRCGQCWPCQVFGSSGGRDLTALSVGRRALVRVPDAAITEPAKVTRPHVAIDRFTGGAAPGLLYAVDALEAGTFELVIEPLAAGPDPGLADQLRAVLRLVLEDLDDGIAGLGAGVARGYGTVRPGIADAEQRGDLPGAARAREIVRQLAGAAS